jgi:hypothetical protein
VTGAFSSSLDSTNKSAFQTGSPDSFPMLVTRPKSSILVDSKSNSESSKLPKDAKTATMLIDYDTTLF